MNNKIEVTEIVVLGDPGSGKTSLCYAMACDDFREKESTEDERFDFSVTHDHQEYPLEIVNYINSTAVDYQNNYFFLVTFSTTKSDTYLAACQLIEKIKQANPLAVITMVGTKSDLKNDQEVNKQDVEIYLEEKKITYIETSASRQENIDLIKSTVAKNIAENPTLVLILKLKNYVHDIESHTINGDIDFEHGFKVARGAQGKNRHANFLLAKKLIDQLKNPEQSIESIFSEKNITTLRNGAVKNSEIKLSFFWPKTERGRVKDIIDEARELPKLK